jgi:hypothetical protein
MWLVQLLQAKLFGTKALVEKERAEYGLIHHFPGWPLSASVEHDPTATSLLLFH